MLKCSLKLKIGARIVFIYIFKGMEKLGQETQNPFNMHYRKLMNFGILFFVLQMVGIGLWFFLKQPEKIALFNTLSIAIFLFVLNILIGFLFFVLKKVSISKLFFGNSVLCPLIFVAWWIIWFMYYAK